VWGVHDDWLFVQYYACGIQDLDDYVACDVFDVIPRNEKVRKIDIYDMESDRIFDGIFELEGNEGKGRLWVDGSIDGIEERLTILLRGPD